MGFFKSVRQLNKQANEIQQTWDAGAQLGQAQAQMSSAQQLLADQTAAANAAVNGFDVLATVGAVRQAGGMVNFQPMVEVDVTISRDGVPPYPATVRQVIPQVHLARAHPGSSFHAKADRGNPGLVWINWDRPAE